MITVTTATIVNAASPVSATTEKPAAFRPRFMVTAPGSV